MDGLLRIFANTPTLQNDGGPFQGPPSLLPPAGRVMGPAATPILAASAHRRAAFPARTAEDAGRTITPGLEKGAPNDC